MAVTDEHRESLISLAEAMGLNERERAAFVAGRDGPSAPGGDGFDGMVDFGRRELGLSEAGARVFAIGRDGSENAARRAWGLVETGSAATPALTNTQRERLLSEADQVAAAYQSVGVGRETAHRWAKESLNQQLTRQDVPADQRADRAAIFLREYATVVHNGGRR
jgi:hypothetical protein